MKIKTRLRLNTYISIGAVFIILLSIVWSFREIIIADRNMELADEMRKVAFERILLRDEYLLYQEERPKTQWYAKSEVLRDLLAQADTRFDREKDKALLQDAQKDFEVTFSKLSRVMEGRAREDPGANKKDGFSDADLRMINQIFLKAYSLVDNINRLHESVHKASISARNRGASIILFCIVGGLITIIINSAVINRTLAKRIAALRKGVEVIGAGNLEHCIEIEGDDELCDLARTSNEMAAKLKLSYTSVENLQKEIAERKRVQESLQKTQVLLNETGRIAKIGGWEFDVETLKQAWTEEVYRIHEVDMTYDPTVNSGISFYTPASRPIIEQAVQRAIEYGEPFDMELEFITAKGNHRWVHSIGKAHQEHGTTKKVLGVFQDVTERKLVEEKLNRYIVELKRSNEELKQFAYIASHDLQEPLRMIASYMQLIERRYKGKLDKDADEFIGFATEGAIRLQEMITGLLHYSRVETKGSALLEVNSSEILGKAISNLKIQIEESGALVTADRLPVIKADAGQFVQVFQNLIANAIKFKGEATPHIHVSAEQKGSEWVYSVRDNGIGISAEYNDRIFNIFQRLHGREYPGVGIGLSLCRRIVERHGGRIWFESEVGKGTTFCFTIPIKKEGGKNE